MTKLEQTLQDSRYAMRLLAGNLRFTTVVTLTLALGIGVNAAVFTVIDAVLLQPLAYPDADRLTWLADFDEVFQHDTWGSRADYLIWRAQATSFDQMTAYGNLDFPLVVEGEASQERILSFTGDFWAMTGAKAVTGRLVEPGETNRIVLSHELAARRFASGADPVGRTVTVDGHPFTVAGVLPPSFRFLFPQQASTGDERREIDAYIPLPEAAEEPGQPVARGLGPAPWWISVVGKLRLGVSLQQAAAEMEMIHARIGEEFPHPVRHRGLTVASLHRKLVGGVWRALIVLFAAAGFVLLIAGANVGNLALAQASKRRREIAIRGALGAERTRIVRQLLTEGVIFATLGGAFGLLLARWLLAICVGLGSGSTPRLEEAAIDGRVIAFAFAVSLLTAGLISAGALFAKGGPVLESLRGDLRAGGDGLFRLRGLLVAGELALALVLLTGAGLMLASFSRMNERPAGYSPANTLSMRIPLSGARYESWPAKDAYIRELLARLEQLPGVQAAGIDVGTFHTPAAIEGVPSVGGEPRAASVRMVSQGYLRAMGVPLVRGRWPEPREDLDAVLVNEAFVRSVAAGVDPVGKRIGGSFLSGTIVGVVADFKHSQLDTEPSGEVYYPYQLSPTVASIRVLVKATNPGAMAAPIREVVSDLDPTQPVYRFASVEELLSDSIAPRLFNLALLASFSVTAVLMALVGIYGLMSFVVAQRTREVGIRMALGATRREVVRMIVRQGMGVALGGAIAGLAGAMALTRLMKSLLYGVEANDPATFAAVTAALMLTALLACLLPALKAAGVDPVTSLRHE